MCTFKLWQIFWEPSDRIYNKQKNLIALLRSALLSDRAALYSENIRSAWAMFFNCIGLICVRNIHICCPYGSPVLQQPVYFGHKKIRCLLFGTGTSPDGLMLFCDGQVEGCRPELFILHFLGLDGALEERIHVKDEQFYVYGDTTYICHTRPWLLAGFTKYFSTSYMPLFN